MALSNRAKKFADELTLQVYARAKRVALPVAIDETNKIINNMKLAAPRELGSLQRSIHSTVREDGDVIKIVVKAGGALTTKHRYDYALGQEYGNRQHPAQPFFWPIWRLMSKAARSRVMRAIKKDIER